MMTTSQIKTDLKLHLMGKRFRAGHAKAEPVGDKIINAARGVIWEAWERGLDNSGSIYPSVPLLEQLTQPQAPEPESPELGD